jgi:transcriptional regulator with XRE-family HTH domain
MLARLFRTLSGDSQREFARKSGVHPALLAQYETGEVEPGMAQLARLAEAAGYTVAAGGRILDYAATERQSRKRAGAGIESLGPRLSLLLSNVYRRLLRLPPLDDDPP